METNEEIWGKAYVHCRAWHDSYTGLVDQNYLDSLTFEKCKTYAYRWQENVLVAKDNDKVIGFVAYGICPEPLSDEGEIYGLHVVKEYYKKKVANLLLRVALNNLSKFRKINVWVLAGDKRSIKLYEKSGFKFDGVTKQINLGTPITEIRMVLKKN